MGLSLVIQHSDLALLHLQLRSSTRNVKKYCTDLGMVITSSGIPLLHLRPVLAQFLSQSHVLYVVYDYSIAPASLVCFPSVALNICPCALSISSVSHALPSSLSASRRAATRQLGDLKAVYGKARQAFEIIIKKSPS